jgi:hypothetical protein
MPDSVPFNHAQLHGESPSIARHKTHSKEVTNVLLRAHPTQKPRGTGFGTGKSLSFHDVIVAQSACFVEESGAIGLLKKVKRTLQYGRVSQ